MMIKVYCKRTGLNSLMEKLENLYQGKYLLIKIKRYFSKGFAITSFYKYAIFWILTFFKLEYSGVELIRHVYIHFVILILKQPFVKRPRSSCFHFRGTETEFPICFEPLAGGHTTSE